MSKIELNKSYFVSFCIEQYKSVNGMNGADVAELFFTSGVADYLRSNYEVLHTQSRQWIMEEINDFIKKRTEQ